nr:transposase [Microvirga sp. Mcv34]
MKSSSECHLRRPRAQARRSLTRIRKLGTIVRAIVERTLAWLTTNRRLAKDYERFVETGEMLLYLAMSRILLRRLTSKRER